MTELWRMSVTELAALVRDRQVSVPDVIETHLRRIDAVNPALNAVVICLDEQALAAASGRYEGCVKRASADSLAPVRPPGRRPRSRPPLPRKVTSGHFSGHVSRLTPQGALHQVRADQARVRRSRSRKRSRSLRPPHMPLRTWCSRA